MCGIAGILSEQVEREKQSILILRMRAAIAHRGPDGSGIYQSQDGIATFAHSRLAILDLSAAGDQPMSVSCESTGHQRYWIAFNGEIYNFRKLRNQLIEQGERFHSQTDTEVILKLYQRVGEACVHYLRGMFAFAIWDDREKTCFLARDPLGVKPLYYWQSGSTLLFASEIRAVAASQLPSLELSPNGLYSYLISGSVAEPDTLLENIHCLPAGHWLTWHGGAIASKPYWQLDFTPEKISKQEAILKVRTALEDSIQHHLVSDLPVGIFLSGGVDSSAIAALVRQIHSGELRTFAIAFADRQWNEGDIAQKVAREFGTEHTEFEITTAIARSLFPDFLKAIDQPSIDGFNTFCISQFARNAGSKVVLSGLGGDEFFGGYASFQRVPQMVRWNAQVRFGKGICDLVGRNLEDFGRSPKFRRLGDFLQRPANSWTAYRSFRGIFSHREACAIARHYLPDLKATDLKPPVFPLPPLPSLEDEVSLLEINCYMRNQLLRDSDVMSMASGLELRVPFVDRVLLEAIASIPSAIRLAKGKQLLIDAVPELPAYVFQRPKQGFAFPLEQWMQTEWKDYFQPVSALKGIPLNAWYRRWSLGILDRWWAEIRK